MKFLLAGCLFLVGCTTLKDSQTFGGAFTTEPSSGTYTIQVIYGSESETRARCAKANRLLPGQDGSIGCAWNPPFGGPTVIYIRKPASWDDAPPICQLGHEVIHKTGGEH